MDVYASRAQSHLGGKRSQQDCGFSLNMGTWSVAAVFDGHGKDGFSDVAARVARSFVERPEFYSQLVEHPHGVAQALFDAMQCGAFEFAKQRLTDMGIAFEVRDGHLYCAHEKRHLSGGTTATLVFVDITGLVTTLNVGDSDAWLYTETEATKLSAEHVPETPDEYARLMAFENTTCVYDRPSGMPPRDGSDVIPQEVVDGQQPFAPYYVSNLDNKPATVVEVVEVDGLHSRLAMTRAIGDENMRKGGVVNTASVSRTRVVVKAVLKVASDGYWDAIKTSEALTSTNEAVSSVGFDADALCRDWFQKTKTTSDDVFRGVGDNMWGYVITMKPAA